MYLHIYKNWDAVHITGHHTYSSRNPVIHVFLIQPSTCPYDSTVLCQITHDTQKLYCNESTMHPKKNLLYIKTKGHYFPTDSHVWQNIHFLLVALCLLTSIRDLFFCLHHQGIDILVGGKPKNFFRGQVQQIQSRTQGRENGDLGAVAP
jgi:hypothetical protein